jgi:hypothetical protein
MSNGSRQCWTRRTETGVIMVITGRSFVGTRPVASLHERSMAKDATETTATYALAEEATLDTRE